MTRLALAKTIVKGSITLQGITHTFSASASGTATADRVPEAKKLAVAASNSAATMAARASIYKILIDNSDVLSDLEITSLISNNLKTTVVVFKPIALASIATTTDGVNYILNPNVTIMEDQTCTIPVGKTLIGPAGNPFINNGYFQIDGTFNIGVEQSSLSTALKGDLTTDYINTSSYLVKGLLTIYSRVTFTNIGKNSYIWNEYKGFIMNNGTISNSGPNSYIYNEGEFINETAGIIINAGVDSQFLSDCDAYFTNNGTISNRDPDSSSTIPTTQPTKGVCYALWSSGCNFPCGKKDLPYVI
jgi:hypothetical protein